MIHSAKLQQATLLLALAIACPLATAGSLVDKQCDFKLNQSTVGNMVHISVGDVQAFIKDEVEPGEWRGFVLNGKKVTLTNYTGELVTSSYADLPPETTKLIEDLVSRSQVLYGLGLLSNGRQLLFDSTDVSSNVKLQENYSYRFEQDGAQTTIYLRGAFYNYRHAFYRKNSAVTLINKQCEIEVMPIDKVPSELQAALKDSMDNY